MEERSALPPLAFFFPGSVEFCGITGMTTGFFSRGSCGRFGGNERQTAPSRGHRQVTTSSPPFPVSARSSNTSSCFCSPRTSCQRRNHAAARSDRGRGGDVLAPPAQLQLWLATVFFAKGLLISLWPAIHQDAREESSRRPGAPMSWQPSFLYGLSWRRLPSSARAPPERPRIPSSLPLSPHRHLDAHAVRFAGHAHRLRRNAADGGGDRGPFRAARQPVLLGDGGDGHRVYVYFIWLMNAPTPRSPP